MCSALPSWLAAVTMPCLAVRSPSARAALSSVITTLADLAVVIVFTSAVDITIASAVTIAMTSDFRHAFRVDLKPRCR